MVQIWSCWSIFAVPVGLEHFPIDEGDADGDETTENLDPALWWPEVDGDLAPWIELPVPVNSWIGVNGLGDLEAPAEEDGGLGGNLELR